MNQKTEQNRKKQQLFQFDNVSLKKGNHTIIQDASFTVAPGDFTVLLGPSGVGKTSLLRLFNALEIPTTGKILYKGKNLLDYSIPQFRRRVVMILQKPVVFGGKIRDNLTLPFALKRQKAPVDATLKEFLGRCHLSHDLLNESAENLSGGEQQRLALVRALLLNPDVLLLDEPTASLDVESEKRVIDLLLNENQESGRTLVCVTHSLPLIQAASRLVFMDQGKIVAVRSGASNDEIRAFMKEALDGKGNH